MDFIVPLGLANLLSVLVHLPIPTLEIGLTILEIVAIVFGKFPRIIKFRLYPKFNGVIFFLLLNFLTNIAVFLWVFWDLRI